MLPNFRSRVHSVVWPLPALQREHQADGGQKQHPTSQTRAQHVSGKDEVYDGMLLDYFLSYHQFIHLLCRVAINCEKFTDTLVKLSVLIAYEGLPLHLALFPKLWTELCQSQYIKCILMDERTFLNNNVVYSFLTCFLPKVQHNRRPFHEAEDEGATPVKRRRLSSDDDRAGNAAAALCMTSSSALPVCNEPKPDHQEALTPTSTSDTETRDSSSLIDPGTEQDPPSPEPTPATSRNLDSSLKEEKMEASSSSSSSSFSSSSSSSLLQEAGEGFVQGEEPEVQQPVGTTEEQEEEQPQGQRGEPPSASSGDMKEVVAKSSSGATLTLPEEDAALSSALGLVGEGPDGTGSHSSPSQVILSGGPPPDMLDMLYRTVEATIAIVTKLSVKALPSS
ncbi:hypothetical protein XENOCAPTIV_005937 [Xenoophorus captivus]|uniref:Uncharacterized protein n=1 Tax=Xenoophorus captivus TaxID=1517983 RepID=A0ABV0RPS6_9TELE